MKKIIAITLALVMLMSFAACGNKATNGNATEGNTETNASAYANAAELLATVFAAYAEDQKFSVVGGDETHAANAPAEYDYTLADELNVVAQFPTSQSEKIEGAATAIREMNANQFTCAAYLLKADADATEFAAEFKTALDNARWMCGFPEKYVVIKADSYVVTAYGLADFIEYFKTTATENLTGAEVVAEGDIA